MDNKKTKQQKKPHSRKDCYSEYNMFVKLKYKLPEIQALPYKQRFAAIAKLWKKHKKKW